MSKFIKDSEALKSAMGASEEERGIDTGEFTLDALERKKGIKELMGTAEINSDWVTRLQRAGQSDGSESELREDLPVQKIGKMEHVPQKTLTVFAKGAKGAHPRQIKERASGSSQVAGISSHELKAMEDYERRGPRTNEQLEAFIEGYRVKQDYHVVAMQAHVAQMGKLIDSLTSATTSITRASSDLVDSTNLSTSKLASAVTGHIDVRKGASSSGGISARYTPGPAEEAIAAQVGKDAKEVVREAEASNKKESERIKSGVTLPAKSKPAPPEPAVRVPLTQEELCKIMGVSAEDLMKGYAVSQTDVDNILASTEGPLSHYLSACSGMKGAKGHLKKIINMVRNKKG